MLGIFKNILTEGIKELIGEFFEIRKNTRSRKVQNCVLVGSTVALSVFFFYIIWRSFTPKDKGNEKGFILRFLILSYSISAVQLNYRKL